MEVFCLRKVLFILAGVLVVAAIFVGYTMFIKTEPILGTTLKAKKADVDPVVDGNANDPAWKNAQELKGKNARFKAVHSSKNLTILVTWADPTLSMNTAGSWQWQNGKWQQTRSVVKWESFKGKRHPEWLGLSWNINASGFGKQGCISSCHSEEDKHHKTDKTGEYIDSWNILAKHGYGPDFLEDQGWLAGSSGASQSDNLKFIAKDAMDSTQLTEGRIQFTGFAEDNILSGKNDVQYPKENHSTRYCTQCHSAPKAVHGDDGQIQYLLNRTSNQESPAYIETNPQNFIDAMILTKVEIDSGEAQPVFGLTLQETDKIRNRYRELNAVVPQLVLQNPSGSQKDIKVGAVWENGRWTVEIQRALVTGNSDDVQFKNLNKNYEFAVSLWAEKDLAREFRQIPLFLKFEK